MTTVLIDVTGGIGVIVMVLGGLFLGVCILGWLSELAGNAVRSALRRWIDNKYGMDIFREYRDNREKFLKWNESPPVDAMDVVRCKSCTHHCKDSKMPLAMCEKWGNITRDDDFCSYGEREEHD